MSELEQNKPEDMEKEIEKIYTEFSDRVFRFVYSIMMDKSVAEDITQETFLEAVRHYQKFSCHPNQKAWLYKVARYKINNHCKKYDRIQYLADEQQGQEPSATEEGYFQVELKELLEKELTKEEQTRFERSFMMKEEISDMARMENITDGNMRVRLNRMYKKIYEIMEGSKKEKKKEK